MFFPSFPLSYAVELTYACNNSCSGCANVLNSQHEQELSDWQRLFDRLAPPEDRQRYVQLFRITGGEPTLHPEFAQIIDYIDSFGISHVTFTNGRWQKPDEILRLFQGCTNFIGVLVSLHGSTAAAHSAFIGRDGTAFTETCVNIRKAVDVGIEVFTNTVLTKYSCGQVEEIIELSQRLGAGYAVFNRYLGKPNPIEPRASQLRTAIQLIEKLQHEGVPCHVGDCVPPCFVKNSSLGSNSGIEHCIISPQGFVRPDNLTSYTFGNLFEQTIEEIWQSEQADWYRSQIPEPCLECMELPRCRGGCRSVTIEYGLEGDRLMKAPIREATQETLEIHPDWRILPHFTIREEPFGYLLCRMNWSVPVSHEAKPLLDALNGGRTLGEVHTQFGDAGLDLIAYLYREGCLEFE